VEATQSDGWDLMGAKYIGPRVMKVARTLVRVTIQVKPKKCGVMPLKDRERTFC